MMMMKSNKFHVKIKEYDYNYKAWMEFWRKSEVDL